MKRSSCALLLAVGVTTTSCGATTAQIQYRSDEQVAQQASLTLKACMLTVSETPSLIGLRQYMRLDRTGASITQMSNQFYLPSEEQPILAKYENKVASCERAFRGQLDSIDPSMGQIVSDAHALQKENDALLISHEETLGKFNITRQDIGLKASQAMINAARRLTTTLNAENEKEIQERQQAWENFSKAVQEQQIINAETRTVTTNCNSFGSSVSCTSN